jgi:hypothetical protein
MSDVPSNLIPTRITQLPIAPEASEDSLMMIVYQGNNYQIRVGDLLSVAGVPTTTQVIAGTSLTGGGQLTGNVTLSVANGGITGTQLSATGVTAGSYGDATNIPVFTVDSTGRVTAASTIAATISGYVPVTRQVIAGTGLTGGGPLNANVTLAADLSDSLPLAGLTTGSAGVATSMSRSDHKHPQVDLSSANEVENILGLSHGGTAKSIVPMAGAVVWSGADGLYVSPAGTAGQVLVSGGASAPTWGTAGTGTVTSVAMTVPTGLSISGTPITTSGTLALTLAAGYSIPTDANQTNWTTAYTQTQQWNGGSTNLVSATGRASLGGTTVGQSMFTLTNPSAITFPQFNADNTVSALTASAFRTAIGAGTSSTTGTVTSVGGTGTVNGITLTGTVTSTGNLTLGGTLSGVSLTTQVSGTLPVANGGTGTTTPALVAGTNVTITGTWPNQTINASGGGGSGTVTTVSVVGANGFAGTVANATTTPAITLTTSITGLLKGNGTAISAATSGTDYSAGTSALTTGILKSTTSTGALTIAVAADFPTLNQSTTGNATTATTATNLASGSAGTIPYQSASGTTAMLAVGTTGQVLTSNGAAAPTWATASGGGATKTISNKTGAYTIVSGDLGTIINCTSGTFTVSLTAAATLGAGFTCTIWNTSATVGDAITIDPNAAETIDGVATLILRRGEGLDIVCDGTSWQTSYKKTMRGYAENIVSTDLRPVASGRSAIAIGTASNSGSTASGSFSIAIGSNLSGNPAISSGTGSTAIGLDTSASSNYSAAIGDSSGGTGSRAVTGAGAMALGGSYASGGDSFAAATTNNTSSYGATNTSSIALGALTKATGIGTVSIGNQNTASGNAYGACLGGYNNTASGERSTTIGGTNNVASGKWSVALGENALANIQGKMAFSVGIFSTNGDAQYGLIVLRAATTTTTAVALTSDGAAATTTNQLILASGQAMAISGTLIAKQSASGNMAGWTITGIVSNNAGTMTVSGLALTLIGVDSIVLGVNLPTIAVDNTNKGVTITSGFKAATSIRWVANVQTSEVTYA